MTFVVVVNVNLEYTFDVDTKAEAVIEAQNVELPQNYIVDSFEIVKVMTDD